jgi:hypothetical protein
MSNTEQTQGNGHAPVGPQELAQPKPVSMAAGDDGEKGTPIGEGGQSPPPSTRRGGAPRGGRGGGGDDVGGNDGDSDGAGRPRPNLVQVKLVQEEDELVAQKFLWDVIKERTEAIGFDNYRKCIDGVLCGEYDSPATVCATPYEGNNCVTVEPPQRKRFSVHGPDAYLLLKAATECFLMQECGRLHEGLQSLLASYCDNTSDGFDETVCNEIRQSYFTGLCGETGLTLPYFETIREKLAELPLKSGLALGTDPVHGCYGILKSRVCCPLFIELIWSYWHEEGMLVQTMNAISMRFQNIRNAALANPLAHLTIDPLRPLNNLLWGFVQDERVRLSLVRRAYEYDHEYGLTLVGKAVPKLQSVDGRLKFLETFHNVLHEATLYYQDANNNTITADGFPLLNALKDAHMVLAQGAHNQFGDLPWTARVEMMIMQWLLARPEFREFLGGRIMVPYTEAWMDRVDTMKSLQGWTDTSVNTFNFLAIYGEQILISIRYTEWSRINDADVAGAWALFWRPQIQGYIHYYRTVTGVDLAAEVVNVQQAAERSTPPALYLRKRLAEQRPQILPPPASRAALSPPLRAVGVGRTRALAPVGRLPGRARDR